jgi:hypothetical protein
MVQTKVRLTFFSASLVLQFVCWMTCALDKSLRHKSALPGLSTRLVPKEGWQSPGDMYAMHNIHLSIAWGLPRCARNDAVDRFSNIPSS